MAWATTAEILLAIQMYRPRFTSGQINAQFQIIATTQVNRTLRTRGLNPSSTTDIDNLLKEAEIAFYLEYAAMSRQIETSQGEVMEQQIGRIKTQYGRNTPMFFMANGPAESFMKMLPHESFRMIGFSFIDAFIHAHFQDNVAEDGDIAPSPVVVQDTYDWTNLSTEREEE